MKASIGQNISKYRKSIGLTQAELAEKMNVSIQAISKWENDICCPDIERIGQLAYVLRRWQALSGMTGRKGSVGGAVS